MYYCKLKILADFDFGGLKNVNKNNCYRLFADLLWYVKTHWNTRFGGEKHRHFVSYLQSRQEKMAINLSRFRLQYIGVYFLGKVHFSVFKRFLKVINFNKTIF